MGLAATAAKFFSSLCVLLLGVLALQSYGYFISAVVRDVRLLTDLPFYSTYRRMAYL